MKFTRIRVAALAVVFAAILALPLGAQSAAPFALGDFFTKAPTVTVGFEGEYGSALAGDPALGWDDAYDNIVFDPMITSGTAFVAAPWVRLDWGGLVVTTRYVWDMNNLADALPDLGGDSLFWTGDYAIESAIALDLGPLTISERLLYDAADATAALWWEEFGATFESGKISAGLTTFSRYDRNASFLVFNGLFDGYVVGDAWMQADGLGGLVDLRIGGIDAQYLRMRSLFFDEDPFAAFSDTFQLLLKPVFASQSRTRGLMQVRTPTAVGAATRVAGSSAQAAR